MPLPLSCRMITTKLQILLLNGFPDRFYLHCCQNHLLLLLLVIYDNRRLGSSFILFYFILNLLLCCHRATLIAYMRIVLNELEKKLAKRIYI